MLHFNWLMLQGVVNFGQKSTFFFKTKYLIIFWQGLRKNIFFWQIHKTYELFNCLLIRTKVTIIQRVQYFFLIFVLYFNWLMLQGVINFDGNRFFFCFEKITVLTFWNTSFQVLILDVWWKKCSLIGAWKCNFPPY